MAKIFYLYTEVMPYVEAVINVLVEKYNDEVCVISWDKNNKTSYKPLLKSVKYYRRSELQDNQIFELISKFNPDLIYISGRIDKGYLKAVKEFKKKGIPILSGMDNQWHGDLKSILKIVIYYFLFKKYFTHIIVPGSRQYMMARLLGYKNKILLNLYSGDINLFYKHQKNNDKKKVIFLGRLEEVKALDMLLDAWKIINKEKTIDWELVLIGSGTLEPIAKKIKNVRICGFLSQKNILNEINGDCIFCLPSRKEPWGVVVHEMAAAGLPMILTKEVGAGDTFLISGYNGYLLENISVNEIIIKLKKMMDLNPDQRAEMGKNSRNLALRITPDITAASIKSLIIS